MPRHPKVFDHPGSPYLPDMPPLARRASAVADLLEAGARRDAGSPPPNLDEGVRVLLAAIGDKELADMYADGRHREAREWLLFLSVVVQAEMGAKMVSVRFQDD